jgi:hypothetical protein
VVDYIVSNVLDGMETIGKDKQMNNDTLYRELTTPGKNETAKEAHDRLSAAVIQAAEKCWFPGCAKPIAELRKAKEGYDNAFAHLAAFRKANPGCDS